MATYKTHTRDQRVAIARERGSNRTVAARHGLPINSVRVWRIKYGTDAPGAIEYAPCHAACTPLVRQLYTEVAAQQLSMNRLAIKAGCTATTLNRMFYQGHLPTTTTLIALAEVLGYEVTLTKREEKK